MRKVALSYERLKLAAQMECTVEGCSGEVSARGWCHTHYMRWRKHGDVRADVPLRPLRYRSQSLEERFWEKVDKSGGCWVWTANQSKRGYGLFRHHGTYHGAHRVSWELANGPIPDGLYVCHHCDNPPCVRPDHLFVGCPKDNTDDARRKGRFPMPPTAPRPAQGEACGRARLNEAQVREVRRRYAAGESQVALGREYGVAHSTVAAVTSGKTWRHLL